MLPTSTTPTTITALSARCRPNTAYDANIEVAQMISPMIVTWWRNWTVDESPRTTTSMNAPTLAAAVAVYRSWNVAPAGASTMPVRIGTIRAAKIEPIRYVSQRPQPTLAPTNATSTPPAAA